ncbi:MAG: hypothetical protein H6730_36380, partial [Deltaproteobacteria bacterium]|nr:hypothetical protein [Deltaproteobacteria bacterium]
RWPLLYLGVDHGGAAAIQVYDLSGPAPVYLSEAGLPTGAVDMLLDDDQVYVARPDGLTLLEQACGP